MQKSTGRSEFVSGFIPAPAQGLGRRIPFSFLEDIKQDFLSRFQSQARTAAAYELDGQYSAHLEERLNFFSNDRNADTINRVRGEISEVRKITVENIEKVSCLVLFTLQAL